MRDRVSQCEVEVKRKVVSVGVDVHKRSWTVTVRVEGTELYTVSSPPEYRTLKKLLDRFKGGQIRVPTKPGRPSVPTIVRHFSSGNLM